MNRSKNPAIGGLIAVALVVAGCSPMWPTTSTNPVVPLSHPLVEERAAALDPPASAGYRFVMFGDQRAMADGEWQSMIATIADAYADDDRMLFAMDTGDCVDDGQHSDQWTMLADILEPIDHLPYVVAIGNHELDNHRTPVARRNAATFFSYLDPHFGTERMFYRKDIGPVTFLVLDTNELVYGPEGEWSDVGQPAPSSYAERQFAWFAAQLASIPVDRTLVVALHHPFIQSSRKHLGTARGLWNVLIDERPLPDLMADAGVDVVLVGHTHTYEQFRLVRQDGRVMHVVNVSGRPRNSFLWFGAGQRRVQDIAGREHRFFTEHGFMGLDRWEIAQTAAMVDAELNQFAVFEVGPDGSLTMQVHYVDADGEVTGGEPAPLELSEPTDRW